MLSDVAVKKAAADIWLIFDVVFESEEVEIFDDILTSSGGGLILLSFEAGMVVVEVVL